MYVKTYSKSVRIFFIACAAAMIALDVYVFRTFGNPLNDASRSYSDICLLLVLTTIVFLCAPFGKILVTVQVTHPKRIDAPLDLKNKVTFDAHMDIKRGGKDKPD